MSFGKLLAAGRSFIGGQGVGRYRLDPGLSLPNFTSPKNPFARPPRDEEAQTVNSEAPAQNLPNQAADTEARAASTSKLSNDEVRVSVRSNMRDALASRMRKLNPIKSFAVSRSKQTFAHARSLERPVQGELSLERVRVVRNDLADADLEVLPPGSARRERKTLPEEGAWRRLAARVFGTETT
jgi:hypothetical protein